MDFVTEISFCKTPVVDEKRLVFRFWKLFREIIYGMYLYESLNGVERTLIIFDYYQYSNIYMLLLGLITSFKKNIPEYNNHPQCRIGSNFPSTPLPAPLG